MKFGASLLVAATLIQPQLVRAEACSPEHQLSSSVPGARFEIVQSPLAAMWTFRLDRYAGAVWLLMSDDEKNSHWIEMEFSRRPKVANPTQPRFQLFTSGLAAEHTYLVDTQSGDTWQLTEQMTKLESGEMVENDIWSLLE